MPRSIPGKVRARRIAVVGAGGTGACVALELAQRGHRVSVYEASGQAVSQASLANEGKVHLGLIYAKDETLRTASRMIEGALCFEEHLRRWIPFSAADALSTPFYYCVHRGSLMDPDELALHYRRCADRYDELAAESGRDYLGLGEGCRVERVPRDEYAHWIDPGYFTAVFKTTERAVDPGAIATLLRKALADEPRVDLLVGHRVSGVQQRRRGGIQLRVESGAAVLRDDFDVVVNCAWHERLPLDRQMGIEPPGPWSHRYKFANRVRLRLEADALPSCTAVQGPFGDIVNFGERGFFLSWYPTGRTGMSTDEVPPRWNESYGRAERLDVFHRSFAEWKRRCGGLGALSFDDDQVDPNGGVIYALGTTDVDDRESRLHDRFEMGIQSRADYHSIDTGKLTLVPDWGVRVADYLEDGRKA